MKKSTITTTYFALTTGPIFKTLAIAKRTREIWAASYIFSYLMEKIVAKLNENKSSFEIILPVKPDVPEEKKKRERISAGLFPDRLIVISNGDTNKNWKNFKTIVTDEKTELVNEIRSESGISDNDKAFVDNFHTYTLQIELNENEDPVAKIFPLLDTLDQQAAYNPKFKNHILKELFEQKGLKRTVFYQKAFDKGENHRFPQVLEIAAHDLRYRKVTKSGEKAAKSFERIFEKYKDSDGDESKEIMAELKNEFNLPEPNPVEPFKPHEQFRHYHKYMAVVMADGDDVGQIMHALFEYGNKRAIQKFSSILMQFGTKAYNEITRYGGVPIYLGGDDMLFFAPVKSKAENVFMLAQKLSQKFSDLLRENSTVLSAISDWNQSIKHNPKRKPVKLPTLSFGIALSYHKYPLREAIEAARKMLFETAKTEPDKNTVAFRYLKHTGHNISGVVNKNGKTWDGFLEFLNEAHDGKDKESKNEFLSSMQYKLEPLRPILQRVLTGRKTSSTGFKEMIASYFPDEGEREFLLKNFSAKFFNEGGKHSDSREFILTVLEMLLLVYRDLENSYGNNTATADKSIDLVYAILRLKHFYLRPDNEEEE
jgi:CRISPR-associated protein Cmr2